MKKAEPLELPRKTETVNLKVYIHCEGCRKKVNKVLNRLDGVQSITIDSSLSKVTVTGTVDSTTLIKKLVKAGKHAELWPNPQPAGGKAIQQTSQKEIKEMIKEIKGSEVESSHKSGKSGEGNSGGNNAGGNDASGSNAPGDSSCKNSGNSTGGKNAGGKNADGSNAGGERSDNSGGKDGNGGKRGGKQGGGSSGGGGDGKKGGKKGGGEGGGAGAGAAAAAAVVVESVGDVGDHGSSSRITADKNVARMTVVETGYALEQPPLETADFATHMFSDENANNCSLM